MVKIIIFIFPFLFLCFTCNNGNENTNHQTKTDVEEGINIDPVFIQEIETEGITVNGYYPKISGLKNKEFEDKLNSIFVKNTNDFIRWSGEAMVNSDIYFEILTLNDTILSLHQEVGGLVNGTGTSAGIRLHVAIVNADLENEKVLTNEDLKIKDISLKYLNETLDKFFRKVCGFTDMFWEESISFPKTSEEIMNLHYGIKDGNLVEIEFATPCSFATSAVYLIPLGKLNSGFQLQKGLINVVLTSTDTAKIISEVSNGLLNKMEGQFIPKDGKCDSLVNYSLFFQDLDYDNYPEVVCTYYGSEKCFGFEKSKRIVFRKDQSWNWKEIYNSNSLFPEFLGSTNKGLRDMIFYQDTTEIFLRWNGSQYEKTPVNRIAFNFIESQKSLAKKEAVNKVAEWIDNLGKKDFQAAYNQMSPSLRGTFEAFSSTKQYGGITGTKVNSDDIDCFNVSDCYFEVIATYDSFDQVNGNGKFTDQFKINNCNGNWEITSIKRVLKEKI
ncbi:MAG: hypothetical protein JST15_11220 [Bacteroidetes bacterium]|nr:hypothetical protein [Bacteroidota bacterium]